MNGSDLRVCASRRRPERVGAAGTSVGRLDMTRYAQHDADSRRDLEHSHEPAAEAGGVHRDAATGTIRRGRGGRRRSSRTCASGATPPSVHYSEKFDNWSPESFRLAPEEIERIVATVPERGPRRPAHGAGQRPGLRAAPARVDARVRGGDPARRLPGSEAPAHRGDRGLHPRRALPADRVGPHDRRDGEGGRRRAGDGLHAAHPRGDPRGDHRRHAPRRRRRHLPAGRCAGDRGDGGRDARRSGRSTCSPARGTPTWRRRSGSCSGRWGSTCSPGPRRSSSSPTTRRIRSSSPSTCSARPSTDRTHRPCSSRRRRTSPAPRWRTSTGCCPRCRPTTWRGRPGATTGRCTSSTTSTRRTGWRTTSPASTCRS